MNPVAEVYNQSSKSEVRGTSVSRPTLSVIVPVFNEVLYIGELLRRVASAAPADKEIIIVDDCSTDGTRAFLQTLKEKPEVLAVEGPRIQIKIIFHEINQGKGAAIRTGVREVEGRVTIIQDADLEYNPQEYSKLVSLILSGEADVVYGSRFRGEIARVHYFWHALGNKILTLISNICTDLNLTDMETCYKAFDSQILKSIPIHCNRFGFEPEITAKIAKLRCRVYEVPISYHGRGYDEGKKITWVDGIKAVLTILRFWLRDDLYSQSAGLRTLRIMEGAGSYNRWLLEQCYPFLGQRVLEVGAGVGNITKFLLNRPLVVATDFEEFYVEELRRKFSHLEHVKVEQLDLEQSGVMRSLARRYPVDTVLIMNVLEHIEHDRTALQNLFELLPPGGRLVVLVPAHQLLFSPMDVYLGHYRRYSKPALSKLASDCGFRVRERRYLNWLGALGWFVNGRIFRRRLIPTRQLRLFDLFVFVLRIENWIHPPFGLSTLLIAEKPLKSQ